MAEIENICTNCAHFDSLGSSTYLFPKHLCSALINSKKGHKAMLIIMDPEKICINDNHFIDKNEFHPAFSYDDLPKIESEMYLDELANYVFNKGIILCGSKITAESRLISITRDLVGVILFGEKFRNIDFLGEIHGPLDPYSWISSKRIQISHIRELITRKISPSEIEQALLNHVNMSSGSLTKGERKEIANFMTGFFLSITGNQ